MIGICPTDVTWLATLLKINFNLQVGGEGQETLNSCPCNSGILPPGGSIACLVQTHNQALELLKNMSDGETAGF